MILDWIDSTTDYVFAVILAVSLLITLKMWLENQAIRRGGHVPASAGQLWPFLVVVSGVVLFLTNR